VSATVVKGLDENGRRISSMDFEAMIQAAAETSNAIHVQSMGQHNLGIRLQHADGLSIEVSGPHRTATWLHGVTWNHYYLYGCCFR